MRERIKFMTTSKYIPSWASFGWNPWGFGKDYEDKPSKDEMFNGTCGGRWKYVSTIAIEDFLQHNEVFKNGIRGTSCNMDSYMTIVDYNALETALEILVEEYKPTAQEWNNIVEAWLGNPNNQPPAKLVAYHIQRKFVKTS